MQAYLSDNRVAAIRNCLALFNKGSQFNWRCVKTIGSDGLGFITHPTGVTPHAPDPSVAQCLLAAPQARQTPSTDRVSPMLGSSTLVEASLSTERKSKDGSDTQPSIGDDRCIQLWLGGGLGRQRSQRVLDRPLDIPAHKCAGAPSSALANEWPKALLYALEASLSTERKSKDGSDTQPSIGDDRCIQLWLGGGLGRQRSLWTLVGSLDIPAHKCVGARLFLCRSGTGAPKGRRTIGRALPGGREG
ncbi:UNVERIFIED_CONTAM: hypothetical protein FKN15_021019 [Acipenser sinensis]